MVKKFLNLILYYMNGKIINYTFLKFFHVLIIKQVIESVSSYWLCHQALTSQEV